MGPERMKNSESEKKVPKVTYDAIRIVIEVFGEPKSTKKNKNNDKPLERVVLTEGTHVIGRSPNAAVTLNYPTVSKKHAELYIYRKNKSVFVADFSANGTFLALSKKKPSWLRKKLKPKSQSIWNKEHYLGIGPYLLRFSYEPQRIQNVAIMPHALDVRGEQSRDASKDHTLLLQKLTNQYYEQLKGHLGSGAGFTNPKNDLYEFVIQAVRTMGTTPSDPSDPNDIQIIVERLHAELFDNGPLVAHLKNPSCREILINAHDDIFIDVGEGLKKSSEAFLSETSYEAWVLRMAVQHHRRLDQQNPICEATLENGSRFHAVLPPIAATAPSVSIRKFGSAPMSEDKALLCGWVDEQSLAILKEAILSKRNIVISGGTSTGKTSLLNFLCQYVDQTERVITVEDTIELSLNLQNSVQLQGRKANAEGVGAVGLRELVQCALRMRPDRIIVGECRGGEVLDMLQALNTGHPGSLTTVHANSVQEAIHRLELLALLGAQNLSLEAIREWIFSSVNLIVNLDRDNTGRRFVRQIAQIKSTSSQKPFLELMYDRSTINQTNSVAINNIVKLAHKAVPL